MASLIVMSYADIVLAIVPEAPPTRKNQRATSWPAPISTQVPYLLGSRFMRSALSCVVEVSLFINCSFPLITEATLHCTFSLRRLPEAISAPDAKFGSSLLLDWRVMDGLPGSAGWKSR